LSNSYWPSRSAFAALVIVTGVVAFAQTKAAAPAVASARAFMDRAEAELLKLSTMGERAEWIDETYINDDTDILTAAENDRLIARTTELVDQAKAFNGLDLPADLKRKILLLKLSLTMPAPHNAKLREELTQVASSLNGSYGKGKYCPDSAAKPDTCLGIDDLEERMAKSRDPKELTAMWTGWHKVGAPMKDRYSRFVQLSDQGAREIGFADTGVLWRAGYDMTPEQFSAELERLWTEVALFIASFTPTSGTSSSRNTEPMPNAPTA